MLKTETTFKNADRLRHYTLAGITMILSFIATRGEMFGFPSPVNVVIASLSGNLGGFCLAASILSYIISGSVFDGIINLCSIATVMAIRLLINRSGKEPAMAGALFASSAYLLYSAIVSLVTDSDVDLILFRILSSFMCFGLIYSVKICFNKYVSDSMIDMSSTNGIMIAIIFVMTVATLTSVSILGINFGRALGVAVMLFAASRYKYIGGTVFGALATLGVVICSPDMIKNTLLLATAGLICGAFSALGVAAVIISLMAVVVGGIFILGTNADSFKLIADVIVGAVLYLSLPDNKVLSAFRLVGGRKKSPEISCQTAASEMSFASKSVCAIKDQILTVTDALEKKIAPPELSKEVRACVCGDCSRIAQCWEQNKGETASAFSQLSMRARRSGAVTLDDIRRKHKDCCKKEVLMSTYNMLYTGLSYEQGRKEKMTELRELLCSQLGIMSSLLNDLSENTKRLNKIDVLLSDSIADLVYKQGITNAKICAYIDRNNQPIVEMYLPKASKPDLVKLTVEMGELACADFQMPAVSFADNMKKLVFAPSPHFSLEWDTLSTSAVFGDYSGDYYEFLKPDPCKQYVVLSDGMGTGKRARLDSMFAVNLVTRILTLGAATSTAASLINSILRVKSWEESFATLDIAEIDLTTGEMSLFKCGAAPSYLLRKGKITALDAKSFPLGILCESSCETVSVKLEKDDIILVCSDGISLNVIEKAVLNKKTINKKDPQEIVRLITEQLTLKNSNKRSDDVTVLTLKIS